MSLTVIKRPIGHKLNNTDITAVIIDDGTGEALVYTGSAHGLSDGDYIYIESNFDSYNGFKYVDSIAYDSFKIRDSEESDNTQYVQDADISYRTSVLNHGWQAVHNLIVYELESDLWPNNLAEEAYTPTTVVSQADSNGNTLLNLSVGIAGLQSYNYIELVGTGNLSGPYQILDVLHPWQIVINLAYDSGNSFSGYQVVNYYNNYAVNVNIYAGLESGHRWEAKKPFELAATKQFIPDYEGRIKFSIAEILKGYINTRNNLTLDTLPNNLDFHVSFYIEYFESYDQSDGEDITTFEGDTTEDDFIGHAVNAMMPFKSLDSGHMSEYVDEGSFLARWLTLFDRPIAYVDRFFDLSMLFIHIGLDLTITIFKSLNGVTTDTEIITIPNPGSGVIRVPITPESGFDQYCVQASTSGGDVLTLSEFTNNPGAGYDWVTGANPYVNLVAPGSSDWLFVDHDFIEGVTYTITTNLTVTSAAAAGFLGAILDDSFNIVDSLSTNTAGGGAKTNALTFTATALHKKVAFRASGLAHQADILSSVILVHPFNITEQICIEIVDDCGNTFISDDARLTEDSTIRIIE